MQLSEAGTGRRAGVYNRWLKRPFDLGVMLAAHVVLLPVWAAAWTAIPLAIWLWDRGPVFYRQERVGRGGRTFAVYKFRTMAPDADRTGPDKTARNDPRITPVGRVLRRTALDELPQTLSIWVGHMSLVGPRPLSAAEFRGLEAEVPGLSMRLAVRPGLTGLAQVFDPADDPRKKLELDLEYISRVSLVLDLRLLFLSVLNTVSARWDSRAGRGSR